MIQSIKEFISAVKEDYQSWKPLPAWFRGEPKLVKTPLLPRLYREQENRRIYDENQLLQLFRMKAGSFASGNIPEVERTDQWLFLAHHCGVPTRLLDWTDNAMLGLYFALQEVNPVIWMINPIKLNECSLPQDQKGQPHFPLTWPRNLKSIGYLNVNGAWEHDKHGVDLPVAVHPNCIHPRLGAQKSKFTIHGKQKIPMYILLDQEVLKRYELDPTKREQMIEDLRMLGIQETSVFPDLNGLAKELSDFCYKD